MKPLWIILPLLLAAATHAEAVGSSAPPAIALQRATEDGQEILLATVTRGGEPVEGASVTFTIERTFGALRLGQETTLDDGTAAVPFPAGLPAALDGRLLVRAEVAGASTAALLPADARAASVDDELSAAGIPLHQRLLARALGDRLVRLETPNVLLRSSPIPRALWAPRAPLALLVALVALLGGVWLTYGTVVYQLLRIRRGERHASSAGAERLLALVAGLGLLGLLGLGAAGAVAQPGGTPWKAPARAAKKVNPLPADPSVLAAGKALYAEQCLSCHGTKGLGDGPAARDLERPAGNLADPKLWDQTDGEIFWKITEGKKPMPTFSQLLTEEQRWQIVHHMRTLAPKPATPKSANP